MLQARQNKNKYGGVSSSEMQGGGAFQGSSKEFTSYDDNYDSFDRLVFDIICIICLTLCRDKGRLLHQDWNTFRKV